MTADPPTELLRRMVDGPSRIAAAEWHQVTTSTNRVAAEAAARGASEIHLVVADTQTAGRGRQQRHWQAPPGTSLLLSLLVRPRVGTEQLTLLPLVAGLALADTVGPHVLGVEVGLKWPNDLLLRRSEQSWRKAAGILVEVVAGGAIIGIGLNVDWRAIDRPAELRATSISLAEAVDAPVDRWRVLAGLVGVFSRRYETWQERPSAFLDGYRARCVTLGRTVRVTPLHGPPVQGEATGIGADGGLVVATGSRTASVTAGDVEHVR
ncbi:MAG: biotin--[acetyl-CoA-carboxylase] ligase [Egibacteraceae bacterium]